MKKWLAVAFVLAGGLFVLGEALGQRPDRRNWEYFPDMARSWAYKTQSPNPYLDHHQTQLRPAEGTIPRGVMPLHYGPSTHDFVRAGRELTSPFDERHPVEPERAREVFQTFCQPCHGPEGRGDGTVVQAGFPPPPSLLFGKALNMSDGHMFYIVTAGFRKMPSYASQIDPEDRWRAIAYVRWLQGNHKWN